MKYLPQNVEKAVDALQQSDPGLLRKLLRDTVGDEAMKCRLIVDELKALEERVAKLEKAVVEINEKVCRPPSPPPPPVLSLTWFQQHAARTKTL